MYDVIINLHVYSAIASIAVQEGRKDKERGREEEIEGGGKERGREGSLSVLSEIEGGGKERGREEEIEGGGKELREEGRRELRMGGRD